jgi:hypothetical protein
MNNRRIRKLESSSMRAFRPAIVLFVLLTGTAQVYKP